MKIFFTVSIQGRQYFEKNYQKITDFLEDEGYENNNKSFLVGKISKKGKEKILKDSEYIHQNKQLLEKVHQADLCIFECSHNSLTVGLLIEKALGLEKPVIVLHLSGHKPKFLIGLENDKFQLVEYQEKNLTKNLREAITKASVLVDKRFNFFVSSSMLAYLNNVSRKLGVTKSTFIRNLIKEYKKKNH